MNYNTTPKGIKKTYGTLPEFMKFVPTDIAGHDFNSWEELDEIEIERASYLLNLEDILNYKI